MRRERAWGMTPVITYFLEGQRVGRFPDAWRGRRATRDVESSGCDCASMMIMERGPNPLRLGTGGPISTFGGARHGTVRSRDIACHTSSRLLLSGYLLYSTLLQTGKNAVDGSIDPVITALINHTRRLKTPLYLRERQRHLKPQH